MSAAVERAVSIPADEVALEGVLALPTHPDGVVVFSHGSGSGRLSPRNLYVASALHRLGLGTLLLDLLTAEEDLDRDKRFDIRLLTTRLGHAVRFVRGQPATRALSVGLFGASTGAASALRVAATQPEAIGAVVSRGGRPDLAGEELLGRVNAPTLLIVGGFDRDVIMLNESARGALTHGQCELKIVAGATHLFEEPGTLDQVARLAGQWFAHHLDPRNTVAT